MVSKYLRHGHYCSGQNQDQQSEEDEEILKREISLVGLITRARKAKKKNFLCPFPLLYLPLGRLTVPIMHLLSLNAPQQPKKLIRIDPTATIRIRTAVLS